MLKEEEEINELNKKTEKRENQQIKYYCKNILTIADKFKYF